MMKGAPDSAYSEGHFELDIQIPEEYPISPPKVKFLSKVFHPNVHFKTGEICLDILKPYRQAARPEAEQYMQST